MVASGHSGGFFDFKKQFHKILGPKGILQDLPLNCYFRGIEWHEKLRECVNLDDVLKAAMPKGVTGFETFSSST